jgi:hypothetical protein
MRARRPLRVVGRPDALAMTGMPRFAANPNFFMKEFHDRKGHHDDVALSTE